jgi:hypothetical protein
MKSQISHMFTPDTEPSKRERLHRSEWAAEKFARENARGRSYRVEPANDSQWRVIFTKSN